MRLVMYMRKGFTLIELLVVIAIIGILSAVTLASLSNAKDKANIAMRLENTKQLQNALELYFASVGSYPTTGGAWASKCSTWGRINAWIPNLVPGYMSTLPSDPNSDGVNHCCYRYKSTGTDYKLQIGYQCQAYIPNGTYAAYPMLIDPANDGGQASEIVELNGTGITSWAIYSKGAADW
jgi:type II secretion system protein G